jgi:hypothetical protein
LLWIHPLRRFVQAAFMSCPGHFIQFVEATITSLAE